MFLSRCMPTAHWIVPFELDRMHSVAVVASHLPRHGTLYWSTHPLYYPLHLLSTTETYKMIDTCDQTIAAWWVRVLVPEEMGERAIVLNCMLFFLCMSHLACLFLPPPLNLCHRHQRTPDGEMFVVKDPDLFASTIIPQVSQAISSLHLS